MEPRGDMDMERGWPSYAGAASYGPRRKWSRARVFTVRVQRNSLITRHAGTICSLICLLDIVHMTPNNPHPKQLPNLLHRDLGSSRGKGLEVTFRFVGYPKIEPCGFLVCCKAGMDELKDVLLQGFQREIDRCKDSLANEGSTLGRERV